MDEWEQQFPLIRHDEAVMQPCVARVARVAREVTGSPASPLRHKTSIIKVGTGPSHEDPM
jgi:hypothetical protein